MDALNRVSMAGFSLAAGLLLLAGCNGAGAGSDSVAEDDVGAGDVAGEGGSDVGAEASDEAKAETTAVTYEPVVFAVVSDIHVNGAWGTPLVQDVAGLFKDAAGRSPAPELIVVTGDMFDSIAEPPDEEAEARVSAVSKLFETAGVPVWTIAGNHDYYRSEYPQQFLLVQDRAARDAYFEEQLDLPRWYWFEQAGTRFVFVNTMRGDLWDISLGLNGSAGSEQIEWLDQLLSEGEPAVLFMHHPPSTVLEPAGEPTLEDVIQAHSDSVLAVFAGHLHMWARSEEGGVPVYLTEAGWDGEGVHHVRVDPIARTVEILNEDEIDYGELVEHACDPAKEAPLTSLEQMEGKILELMVTGAHAEPAGFGTYIEEAVTMAPLLFKLGKADPSGLALPARLAAGAWQGDPVGVIPPWVAPLPGGPCLVVALALDGPCFETSPVSLTFALSDSFGLPLPAGWQIRVRLEDLKFSGVLTDVPAMEDGLMTSLVDLEPGIEDVKGIIVSEYCGKKIADCVPGEGDMPECPGDPTWEFFDEIPAKCDASLFGIGLRMVLGMMDAVPGHELVLDANFTTWNATESVEPEVGAVSPIVFADQPEGTCTAE